MRLTKKHAWHFVGATLRDGRPVPADGVWLRHDGPMQMRESGLHFSRTPWDALQYAPGETLCLVEVRGDVEDSTDKGICRERRIVCRMDATEMLRYFARMQALSVLDEWIDEPPDSVLEYLLTGDAAASAAARAAAWAAARDAASAAAWAAAWAAARAAASAAACATVRGVWGSATVRGVWDSATAWAAARDAASAAASAAARAAASAAARAAASAAARDDFNALVYECFDVTPC